MRNYKIIGLTGPTGAGKSSVAKILSKYKDIKIIDTDVIARQATNKGSSCYYTLGAVFGREIYNDNGEINRQKLAEVAFSTEDNRKKLNDIVHPWVFLKTFEYIKKYSEEKAKYIFIDAPVLIESNANYICDYVLTVLCPLEIRIDRIIKRDSISKKMALQRINAQNDDEFYKEKSDFIINANSTLEDLENKVEKLIYKLREVGVND